jgi:membrane-associated phospholipid phosphatase
MPLLIAWSRMYRGEHHPTDVVGSLIFAGLWLAATTLLVKPNSDRDVPRRALASQAREHLRVLPRLTTREPRRPAARRA